MPFEALPETIKLRHLASGTNLVDHEEDANMLLLLLKGVLIADVGGRPMAEIEPGEILSNHHHFGASHRLIFRAKTDCVLAVAPIDQFTQEDLFRLFATRDSERVVDQLDGRS